MRTRAAVRAIEEREGRSGAGDAFLGDIGQGTAGHAVPPVNVVEMRDASPTGASQGIKSKPFTAMERDTTSLRLKAVQAYLQTFLKEFYLVRRPLAPLVDLAFGSPT